MPVNVYLAADDTSVGIGPSSEGRKNGQVACGVSAHRLHGCGRFHRQYFMSLDTDGAMSRCTRPCEACTFRLTVDKMGAALVEEGPYSRYASLDSWPGIAARAPLTAPSPGAPYPSKSPVHSPPLRACPQRARGNLHGGVSDHPQ